MYDESILILEDIPLGMERWHPLVVEARYNIYRDAKEWTHAMIMAKLKHESKPNSLEWLLKYADGCHQVGDTKKAIACMKDAAGRFCEEVTVISSSFTPCFSRRLSYPGGDTICELNFYILKHEVYAEYFFNSSSPTFLCWM